MQDGDELRMSEDNKLYLIEAVLDEDEKKLTFASYLKRDYIEKSIVMNFHNDNSIKRIFFSSNNFGTVEWLNSEGLADCHRWENEDMAQVPSYLARHYTAILADGAETMDYARKLIIPDVVDSLADGELAELIRNIIENDSYNNTVDLGRFSKLAPKSEE